jgi:DNA-binding CsgD family transcriptional regulator
MEPAEDATAARHRLFQALVELLCSLDVTLLVVEDMHWADEATLEFLLFLATSRPQPLSLVVTYRAEDLPADSLVRRLSSRLSASGAGLRLTLGPLDFGETSELVSSMLGGKQISDDYAAFVHRHTDGVPLAIEESVRLMSERADLVSRRGAWVRRHLEDIEVPPTIRDVVLERVHRLGPDAQAVLQAAAVLAESADESVLFVVAGLPADHARAGLGAALVARLLLEDHHGLVSFRHALVGRAVYDAVPASERRALHSRAGQALETAAPRPLGQLTRHFRGAGNIENWCRYGEQAADLALASGDEATAGALLHDLLTSASLAPRAVARLASKMPLAAFTGPARYQTLIAALRSVLSAPTLTREWEADLRFQLGRALMNSHDYEAGRTELERSIPHLAHDPVAKEQALMQLAWRCSTSPTWMRRRWLRRAEAVAVPSISAAERLCLVVDRVSTLLALGEEDGWVQANQLPATADTAAERLQLARAALNLGHFAMVWGRYGEARARLDGALDLTGRYGYERLREEILATRARLDWFTGAWDELAERARALEANNDLAPLARLEAILVIALVEIATSRADAGEHLRRALDDVRKRGVPELTMEFAAALARLHLVSGHLDEALDLTDAASGVLAHTGIWVWATDFMPTRVQALLTAGRAGEAAKLVAAFGRGLARGDAPAPRAALGQCRAMLAEARGEHGRAGALFARAASAWQALPRPYDAALARERQAGCLVAAGKAAAGAALLSDVFGELSQLGATCDGDRVARSLRAHGMVVSRVSGGGRRGYGDRLSPRELEVVRLVAAGRTNREIAAALYRSTPTVATQLQSAMRKLGATSRAALAVRAIEAGMLGNGDARRNG